MTVLVPAGESWSNQSMMSSILSSSPSYIMQSTRPDSVCSTNELACDSTCKSSGRKHSSAVWRYFTRRYDQIVLFLSSSKG